LEVDADNIVLASTNSPIKNLTLIFVCSFPLFFSLFPRRPLFLFLSLSLVFFFSSCRRPFTLSLALSVVFSLTTTLYIPPTRMPLKTLTILLSLSPVSRSVEFSRSLSRGNPNPKSHAMGSKSRSDHPHSGDGASPGYVSLSLLLCIGLVRFQRKGEEEWKIVDQEDNSIILCVISASFLTFFGLLFFIHYTILHNHCHIGSSL
jgi:hypothetical protein